MHRNTSRQTIFDSVRSGGFFASVARHIVLQEKSQVVDPAATASLKVAHSHPQARSRAAIVTLQIWIGHLSLASLKHIYAHTELLRKFEILRSIINDIKYTLQELQDLLGFPAGFNLHEHFKGPVHHADC